MMTGADMQREQNMLRCILEIDVSPDHGDQEVSAGEGDGAFERLEHRDRAQPPTDACDGEFLVKVR